jgi:hypothetical protein
MGTYENFQTLCANLTVNNRDEISRRYRVITKRLNQDFWNSESEIDHSRYIGSYGRDTAIRNFHDLDVLFRLPDAYLAAFKDYAGNGPSALLQVVRKSIQKTYPNTDVGGDGQVVVVRFTDGMRFEILPAFLNTDGTFTHLDSNGGGSWPMTNPLPDIDAIKDTDSECNGNLKRLCRIARAWRRKWDVEISGILIDTLANTFIKSWEYRKNSYAFYDWMSRDFFEFLSNQRNDQLYWLAPGSRQMVWRTGSFEYKAKRCYNIVNEAIEYDGNSMPYTASELWRDVYGTFYPTPS